MLFDTAFQSLQQNPSITLGRMSRKLLISRRTIQKAIALQTGRGFRELREEILVAKAKSLFVSEPTLAIKAISFALGYKSQRSFARAVRRATGISPEELRFVVGEKRLGQHEMPIAAKT